MKGAYLCQKNVLKSNYTILFQLSLILSLSVMLALTKISTPSPGDLNKVTISPKDDPIIQQPPLIPPKDPPPPIKPLVPIEVSDDVFIRVAGIRLLVSEFLKLVVSSDLFKILINSLSLWIVASFCAIWSSVRCKRTPLLRTGWESAPNRARTPEMLSAKLTPAESPPEAGRRHRRAGGPRDAGMSARGDTRPGRAR